MSIFGTASWRCFPKRAATVSSQVDEEIILDKDLS